jgi:hypothetical protein
MKHGNFFLHLFLSKQQKQQNKNAVTEITVTVGTPASINVSKNAIKKFERV